MKFSQTSAVFICLSLSVVVLDAVIVVVVAVVFASMGLPECK